MTEDQYYVYILTDDEKSFLYTGYTKDLKKRIDQHKRKIGSQFTKKYNLTKLVYYETLFERLAARRREREIKRKSRPQREKMISEENPDWTDLYENL